MLRNFLEDTTMPFNSERGGLNALVCVLLNTERASLVESDSFHLTLLRRNDLTEENLYPV